MLPEEAPQTWISLSPFIWGSPALSSMRWGGLSTTHIVKIAYQKLRLQYVKWKIGCRRPNTDLKVKGWFLGGCDCGSHTESSLSEAFCCLILHLLQESQIIPTPFWLKRWFLFPIPGKDYALVILPPPTPALRWQRAYFFLTGFCYN